MHLAVIDVTDVVQRDVSSLSDWLTSSNSDGDILQVAVVSG